MLEASFRDVVAIIVADAASETCLQGVSVTWRDPDILESAFGFADRRRTNNPRHHKLKKRLVIGRIEAQGGPRVLDRVRQKAGVLAGEDRRRLACANVHIQDALVLVDLIVCYLDQ